MTEQKRLLNKENNILQNQNIYYADGEEQAKKHLEQFKQNLIESFDEAELREEFIDECKDTEKQENIKLENVDSLFAHKRFDVTTDEDNIIVITVNDKPYDTYEVLELLQELDEENQKLKDERDGYLHDALIYKGFLDDIAKQLEPFSRVPALERAVDNWRDWAFRMTEEYVKLNNKYREECK